MSKALMVHHERGVIACDCPKCEPLPAPPEPTFHVKPEVPAFDELRDLVHAKRQQLCDEKHATWTRMREIRERARADEQAQMDLLYAFSRPLEAEIEAMQSVIIEHHASQVQAVVLPPERPAMMVF